MKINKNILMISKITIVIALIITGCGGGVLNLPPNVPNNPNPVDNAINVPVDTVLSWQCSDPNGDLLTYDIYFGSNNPPSLIVTDSTETTYNPGKLSYNITYYWKIEARDTSNATSVSKIWSFTTVSTPNTPPNTPSNPTPSDGATGVTLNTTLSWQCDDPDGDTLTYDIYFGTSTTPSLVASSVIDTTYDPDLQYDTTYYWKILAKDTFGATSVSPLWSFTTKTNTPPNTPSNPTPSDGATGVTLNTTLSWQCDDPDGDTLTYDIYFGTSTTPSLVASSVIDTTYDPDLQYDTTYYWKIIAKDTFGATSVSPLWSFTTKTNTPPNTPSNPTPSDGATGVTLNATLSWQCDDPDGDTLTYDIYFGTSTTPSLVASNVIDTTYDPDLQYDTTYYWKIIAKDTFGATSVSPLWSFTTKTNTPPNTPSNPTPSDGATGVTLNATLSWQCDDPDGDTLTYDIYFGTSTTPSLIASNVIDTTYDPDLQYDTTYYWKIIAKDTFGATSVSPLWSFTTNTRLRWRYETGSEIFSSPAIDSEVVYIGSSDNYIYALTTNGSLLWRYSTGGYVDSSPAIGYNKDVYFGSKDFKIYALDSNGNLKWSFLTGLAISSSPALGSTETVYIGSNDSNLYALSPEGTKLWDFKSNNYVYSSPAVGSDGTIYFGSYDNYLYALNPDGSLKWKYETGADIYSSPAIGSDGTIYFGSNDRYLYALNPDGSLKWRYETGDFVGSSPAIGSDGTIYFGSNDGYIYALNPDGTEKWKYKTGNWVASSPAIGDDGTIYIGSDDGYLYAIGSNGDLKWKYKTDGRIYSSPVIGDDGSIYFGSTDGYIYALQSDSNGLANAPWPMFHHDPRHTGLAQ